MCKTAVENTVKEQNLRTGEEKKRNVENAMLYLDLRELSLAQALLLVALGSQSPSLHFLIP